MGKLISARLLNAGEKVSVLDTWRSDSMPSDINFIKGDIRNPEIVAKSLVGVDFVHHNAALVPLSRAGKGFWDVNVNGSRIVAERVAKSEVSNFVYMSSSAIFGAPQSLPITTETITSPMETYGLSKLKGELIVKQVLSKTQINCICIRPRTIIGPGRLGIFAILFSWIKENRNVYTIGDGNNLFQFVHANDLIDAYMLASQQQVSADFNVGTFKFGTINELLSRLIAHAQSSSKITKLPKISTKFALNILHRAKLSPLVPYHYLAFGENLYFDTEPLKAIGWIPAYSNDDMITEAYDHFLSEGPRKNKGASPHTSLVSEKILKVLRKIS